MAPQNIPRVSTRQEQQAVGADRGEPAPCGKAVRQLAEPGPREDGLWAEVRDSEPGPGRPVLRAGAHEQHRMQHPDMLVWGD